MIQNLGLNFGHLTSNKSQRYARQLELDDSFLKM